MTTPVRGWRAASWLATRSPSKCLVGLEQSALDHSASLPRIRFMLGKCMVLAMQLSRPFQGHVQLTASGMKMFDLMPEADTETTSRLRHPWSHRSRSTKTAGAVKGTRIPAPMSFFVPRFRSRRLYEMASSGVKDENNSIRLSVQWKKSKLNLFEMVLSSSSETCSESRPLFPTVFLTQETADGLACRSVVGRAADGGVALHGQFDGARFTELPSFEWLARKSRSTRVSVTPSAAVIASTVKTGQKGVCTSRADQAGAGQKQPANRGKERQAATSRWGEAFTGQLCRKAIGN